MCTSKHNLLGQQNDNRLSKLTYRERRFGICVFHALVLTLNILIDYLGKLVEARTAMKWFRGPEYNMDTELAQMEARIRIELAQKGRFSDLWSSWAWKPVLVAMGLMIFQQLSGINAALFNAVSIFQSAGSELDTLVSAVLLNVDQVHCQLE